MRSTSSNHALGLHGFCLFAAAIVLMHAAPSSASAQPSASARPASAPLVVMNLAAHPDDEDGSTLAYYRHAKDAIAYSVIFTRGEGGQNEIGPELYEELGAIRTLETERAARLLGTQVYFLNFKDFGFSKSAKETYERWGGRDHVTAQLVYLIRKLKPDVLFTNHDTTTVGPGRQHGHHQAVGVSAYDAFEYAADPTYHPEQLREEGVDLWQPKRLFLRLWSTDGTHDVSVPVGANIPVTGRTAAETAGSALYEHASQGMDRFAERISRWTATYFNLLRSSTNAPLEDNDLAANLAPNRTAAPDLSYWIDSGRVDALPEGSVSIADSIYVPGETVRVYWDPDALEDLPVRLRFFGMVDTTIVIRPDTPGPARLPIPAGYTPTMPKEIYQYARFTNHSAIGVALYDVRGESLKAAGYLDVDVAPPVLLETVQEVARLKAGRNTVAYTVETFDPQVERLTLTVAVSQDEARTVLDQHQTTLTLDPSSARRDSIAVVLPADVRAGAYTVTLSGLATRAVLGTATVDAFLPARVFGVEIPKNLRVGVVESYDNTLDRALSELGVSHVMLDSMDLAHAQFEDLHTIVVDIRAYLVRDDLRAHNDALLEWVRQGGHLIVNYHKTFEWNDGSSDAFGSSSNDPGNFAPYELVLGRERVTREDAPVTLLQPDHKLFNLPNELGADTWSDWVQERGLYFPDTYDDRYLELLSLQDPGESPLESSTLLANYGNGTYLYTALVWYRQLKTFHPGAYKAFANMISLPLVDGRSAGP